VIRQTSPRVHARRRGFTLTEVLLVLAIIGVIAAMVVPQLLGRQKDALVRATRTSIKGLEDACKQYAIDNSAEFPTGSSDEVLNLLMNPGQNADGRAISPYLEQLPKDAWGQQLFYEYPNTKVQNASKPAIWSAGPNKQNEDGAGDDVTNWQS
jgi:general secretion pathway protein G